MKDLISRQAAIDEANAWLLDCFKVQKQNRSCGLIRRLEDLPSVEPTLYGYKIELLAYIARVMEMEGITAEQAVNVFDDLGMAVRLIIEEGLQKAEEAVING